MTLPANSAEADQFVVVASHWKNDVLEKKTYVFKKHATLGEVFSSLFIEGRTESLMGNTLPISLEVMPDLSCLPAPKSLFERVMEDRTEETAKANDPSF